MHFTNRIYLNEQVDMQKLGNLVLSFFKEEGFITQRINLDHTQIIQAKKGGIMRALLSTNKAFTIIVKGDPNNIDVIMGIREWIEGDSESKLKTAIKTPISFFESVPEAIWAYELEHHLWNHLETNIELGI